MSLSCFAERRELWAKASSLCHGGDCWDNTPVESFFHLPKTELVMHCY